MKYRVKEDFDYNPAGRADNLEVTRFRKGEVYEFEPYTGVCRLPGEMSLKTRILPDNNNGWVWKPEFFNAHFERLEEEQGAPTAGDALQEQFDWQSVLPYDKGDRVMFGGKEYVCVGDRPEDVQANMRSWREYLYALLPLVVIVLDFTAMEWVGTREWAFGPKYNLLLVLNCMALILFMVVMVCIKAYDKNKKEDKV